MKSLLSFLISVVAIGLALIFCYVVLGYQIIIPLLDGLIEKRMVTGMSPSLYEASFVFVIVVLYMLVITLGVIAAGFSGRVLFVRWKRDSI